MNPLLLTDGYKVGHHQQYPNGTTLVYSNFTPRSNKYGPMGVDNVVSFGQQMIITQIHEAFQSEFFSKPKELVCGEMKRELSLYLGTDYDVSHFERLHDLGYLPIHVKILEEGALVPIKVPVLTIYNTHPDFFWVTNYLETIISNLLWKPITSATIAHKYRKVLTRWQEKTDIKQAWFIDWQGHDFSMRGLDSVDAAISSGLGHLTSFMGTDSLPTLYGARKYYGETGFVGGSVAATEHSIACAHMNIADGKIDETEYITHLLKTYPTGILSMVSDTFNLWDILTVYLPKFKQEILARDGKLVIRPDSGDPVDILCGEGTNYQDISHYFQDGNILPRYFEDILLDEVVGNTPHGEHGVDEYENTYIIRGKLYRVKIHNISWNRYDKQYYYIDMYQDADISIEELEFAPSDKGVIELLWDVFGGTINEQGYKVLDSHIGAIYGDSITIDRADEICRRLEAKGFASTNVVLGIGSFTYQYNTRDTFGFAMKATYVEVNGVGKEIFKDPITDDGMKKSATGLLQVYRLTGSHGVSNYILKDKVSWDDEAAGELQSLYLNGTFMDRTTLTEIRNRLK